ncbi:ankyrin repeat domain-containing protein 7-like [Biomphalaria glabrata]|uniref:Ankyrin repeat domain-containing protein 7-like n=1 Tax=Biomphalaria glabrata TaxID=6526 RepID=A0A9W2YCN8_BIOGL|nr:ankyrin repeat domain-containing protein 7-like [Biomphalaria glabrata]XP_055860526.1 ankyrin repeat domain-containing protein 7-like [Biomphalaria glabrata]XP_055860527.1 ankyrin repeat domain-containing protein 7-like [Biomphalaria glabrata]XP_055860528.1 ankyrin repeat domain-containing protein 7-like [Biomphalaria glabrata]XP_055860529.1 ankyrin repeat domain-containing protein 7-like [Biomphalaria glabrata]
MSKRIAQNSSIIECINNDNPDKLKSLMAKCLQPVGTSPKISKIELNSYLLHAAKKNSTKCLEVCLQSGSDVNSRDERGMSAFLYAADHHNLNALQILKSFDADPSVSNNEGTTALMYVCKWQASDCLQYLINLSVDLNMKDKDGCTALKFAAQYDSYDCVLNLINAKADLNHPENVYGYSPLMHALKRDNAKIAQLLITKGANVNIVGNDGKNAISLAFQCKNYDLVESILVNCSNFKVCQENYSYMHKMIAQGNKRIIRLMLIRGFHPIDLSCKDSCFKFSFVSDELSPLCVALLSLQGDVARYFVVNRFFSPGDQTKLLDNYVRIQTMLEQQQPQSVDSLSVLEYIYRHSSVLSSSFESPQWPYSRLCLVYWKIIPLDHPFKTEPCNCTECNEGLKVASNCLTFNML